MTVNTLLQIMDVTRNATKGKYIVNIMMDGYGNPLNAKVDKIRVQDGGVFITSKGIDNSVMPKE